MTKKNITAGLIFLLAASLLLTACSGANQPAPATATVDANAIYTQAAATVQAGLAQTEAAQPQPTATATTAATVAPTNTMEPTMAAGLTATANAVLQPQQNTTPAANATQTTPAAGATTPVAGSATLAPTATVYRLPTATSAVVSQSNPSKSGDKAELVDQNPKDGTNIQKSASFDMTLVLKNTGTTTWTTAYKLAYYAGERMASPSDLNMPNVVKPGQTVKLVFTLTAPDSKGDKKTIIWVVQNADGANFYPVYLTLNVTD